MANLRSPSTRRLPAVTVAAAISTAALLLAGAAGDAAENPPHPWLIQYLDISLHYRDRSAYHEASERRVLSLQMYTSDTSAPGFAFRCEDSKLFVWMSLKALDMEKTLKRKVTRPRDWPLTITIGDAEPVETDWVSMFNGRVYMARSPETTKDVFVAAVSGVPVDVVRNKRDAVRLEVPKADLPTAKYFLKSCDLDDAYRPDIDLRDAPEKLPPGVIVVDSVTPIK